MPLKPFRYFTLGLASSLAASVAAEEPTDIRGNYTATANVSTLGERSTSLNHRIGLSLQPREAAGRFDYRAESYTESSFHGPGNQFVNEHKLETQLNYSRPIDGTWGITAGVLYHTNYTFPDTYYWLLTGVTAQAQFAANTALSGTLLAEKRTRGGRLFYDFSGAAEQRLHPRFSAFVSLHRYENFGEFDVRPTRKLEYEAGVNYLLDKRFNAALSYFRHCQDDDPNDRFAFVKLKLGYNF